MTATLDWQVALPGAVILVAIVLGWVGLLRLATSRARRAASSERDLYERIERPAMPPELRSARLVLNETRIKSSGATRIGARVDQAFETLDGRLVLVETKRRLWARVKRSDQVQLSAQRYILQQPGSVASRQRFADYGYVRVVGRGAPTYLRVALLGADYIEALVSRRDQLAHGAKPWVADHASACRNCRVRNHCVVWSQRKHRPLSAWWTVEQRLWMAFVAQAERADARSGAPVRLNATRRADETTNARPTRASHGGEGAK